MRILVTTDLHLNSKVDDSYRWEFLSRLPKLIRKHKAEGLYILGDLTHAKDNHPAELVNRIVKALIKLSKIIPITILKGNHDYIDPDTPFMSFLNEVKAPIRFIVHPTRDNDLLFLPHTRNPAEEWKNVVLGHVRFIFMHQTITGARASNGIALEGELVPDKILRGDRKILSGDIHVPQRLGKILYVGTPYHVHFGDNFNPRLIMINTHNGKIKNIPYKKCPRKTSVEIQQIEDLENVGLKPGDFLKVKTRLTRSEFHEWKKLGEAIRQKTKDMGVHLRGLEVVELKRVLLRSQGETLPKGAPALSQEQVITSFADKENLESDLLNFAGELI